MFTTRMSGRAFFAVGLLALLLGLMAAPADAAGGNSPALQPSPRPAWYSTLTPPAPPAPLATPVSGASVGPPASAAVPAPVLPTTGATWGCEWLLALAIGCFVVGLVFTVLGQLEAETVRSPEEMEEWPAERLYWSDN